MGILDRVISMPCHPENRGGRRQAGQIRYLVYHYTGNDGDRAANNALYYKNTVVKASAHYFVDDGQVYRSVEDTETAWAVGGSRWRDCPQTGGGSLYGVCTNANSISIELCDTSRDGRLMASEATLELAAKLGQELMAKYHIPIQRVVRHFDVTGKHCPAYFMDKAAWEAFLGRLTKKAAGTSLRPAEGAGMKMYRYVSDMPEWAQAAATKAIRNGYIKMDAAGSVGVWEYSLQPLVWMDRAGMLDRPAIGKG